MSGSVEQNDRPFRLENLPSSISPWPESVIGIDFRLGYPGILEPIVRDCLTPHFGNHPERIVEWHDPFGRWKRIENGNIEDTADLFLRTAFDNVKRRDRASAIEWIAVALYPEKIVGPVRFFKAAAINIAVGYNLGDGTAYLNGETGLWDFTQKKGTYGYLSRCLIRIRPC